jgi:hypothetical protein
MSNTSKIQIRSNGSTALSETSFYNMVTSGGQTSSTGVLIDTNTANNNVYLRIPNYSNTSFKKIGFFFQSSGSFQDSFGSYFFDSTDAITSIVVANEAARTFNAGQIQIYGVK